MAGIYHNDIAVFQDNKKFITILYKNNDNLS